MRRIMCALSALAASLALAAADPKGDAERLQGTWRMISLEINGEAVPEEQIATARLVVEGDRYLPTFGDKAIPETFTLDPETTPKAIDFTFAAGPRKGETVKGIYKLDGDRYVMCRALRPEDGRPKEFATAAESGLALVVWRRDKPAPDARRKDRGAGRQE